MFIIYFFSDIKHFLLYCYISTKKDIIKSNHVFLVILLCYDTFYLIFVTYNSIFLILLEFTFRQHLLCASRVKLNQKLITINCTWETKMKIKEKSVQYPLSTLHSPSKQISKNNYFVEIFSHFSFLTRR